MWKVTAFISLNYQTDLIKEISEDSLAVVKPSMVVMGRDGRPVHRFEVISQVSLDSGLTSGQQES